MKLVFFILEARERQAIESNWMIHGFSLCSNQRYEVC